MEPEPVKLSYEEVRVLQLLSLGWSTGPIAKELGYQYNTVNRIASRVLDRIWPHGLSPGRDRRVMLVLYYLRFYGGC